MAHRLSCGAHSSLIHRIGVVAINGARIGCPPLAMALTTMKTGAAMHLGGIRTRSGMTGHPLLCWQKYSARWAPSVLARWRPPVPPLMGVLMPCRQTLRRAVKVASQASSNGAGLGGLFGACTEQCAVAVLSARLPKLCEAVTVVMQIWLPRRSLRARRRNRQAAPRS